MSSSDRGVLLRRLGRLAMMPSRSFAVPADAASGTPRTHLAMGAPGASPPESGEPRRRMRKRFVPRPLRHAVTAFICLLVIDVFVWPTVVNATGSVTLLRHVNVFWMLAGVALEAAALLSYALLTRTVLPGNQADLWTIIRIDMSTMAVSHVLPGGAASSSGLGYRLFTSQGVLGTDAGFALGTQGIGSALVLNVLLWLALVVSIPIDGVHKVYVSVALASVLLLLAFGGLVYLLTIGEDVAARVIRAVARPIPRIRGDRVEAVVRRIGQRLRALGSDKVLLRRSATWAAANWLLDAGCLWCFVAAFGHYISPIDLFIAYGVGNVLAVIPVTPGGLGIVEATVTAALVGFGLTRGLASLAVIGWRLVNFWLPIPVGAGMYVSLRVDRGMRSLRGRQALEELRHIPDLATPVAGAEDAPPPEAVATQAE